MAAYYCLWAAGRSWVTLRSGTTSSAAEAGLGAVLKGLCSWPSVPDADAGVLHLPHDDDVVVPCLLQDPRPKYLRWTGRELIVDQDPELGVDFVREFGPNSGARDDVLLVSVDADAVLAMNAQALGAAVYQLLDDPHLRSAPAGETSVLRGATVAVEEDCYLIFYRGIVRDPARLSTSEEAEIRRGGARRSAPARSEPRTHGLLPTAVGFTGSGVTGSDAAVLLGRGQIAVLFGRNGAGKTVLLRALQRVLDDAFGAQPEAGTAGLTASLVLQATDQGYAARQFALLLAHLAFQPLSALPADARTAPGLPVRGWDSFDAFDASGGALSVEDLAAQPLIVLQDTLTVMLTQLLSRVSIDVEVLARCIATSPCIVVAPGGRVALGVDVSLVDDSVREAARRFVLGAQLVDGLPGALYPVFQLAAAIGSSLGAAPVPVLSVQLAQTVEGVNVDAESGWLLAGEELEQLLRRDLPVPVAFAPGRQGPVELAEVAEKAVMHLIAALTGEQEEEAHVFGALPALSERVLLLFEQEVTALLPRFIRESGELSLVITQPETWHRRRIRASLICGDTRQAVPLDVLPAGHATWVLAAMTFARERLLHSTWAGKHTFGDFVANLHDDRVQLDGMSLARTHAFEEADAASVAVLARHTRLLFLLDEPEVHLHLTAQRDVVEVVQLLSADSGGAVVATHALAFVDASSASVHTLVNSEGRITMSRGSGLASLGAQADSLGIPTSALAQVYRAALLVEGINDIEVLRRYGGVNLDVHRVVVLPMQGHAGAVNLVEAEFFHALRIPLFVLLDHVRRSVLLAGMEQPLSARLHTEERTLVALHQSLSRAGLSMIALPFAGADIVTAVPDEHVDQLLVARGASRFAGWKHVQAVADEAWQRSKRTFKQTFQAETGVEVDTLLRDLRRSALRGRSPQLTGVLAAMLEELAAPQDLNAVGLRVLKRAEWR